MQVPLVRTVCTPRVYASAFIRAWRLLYPDFPTQAQAGVLFAQWMVETSGKACWNWNIGNVKVTPAQVVADVPWFDLPGTWEIVNGQRVVLKEGDPGRRFRAFTTLEEAMREHLAFLRNKRYAPSWPYVEAGDPAGFARALKRQGYYTAPVDDYASIMVAAHKSWMSSNAFEAAMQDIVDEDEEVTDPEIRLDRLDSDGPPPPDFPIVHPSVFREPDDDPPPEAA